MAHKKRNIVLKIVLGAAAIAAVGFILLPKKKNVSTQPPITVKKETAKDQIQISGYIQAAQEQKLQSPGDGIVQTVRIKTGDRVKKGDLLFSLDSSQQEIQVARQEFAIQQERINGPSRKLELMEKEKELLAKQVQDRSVYASFDGIVAAFNLTEGQYAKAQDTFGMLIDRAYLQTTVEVSESDAPRLTVGEKAELVFPAVPGTQVVGEVIAYPSIARQNTQRGNTVLDAKIRINDPPASILPGYSFTGIIIAGDDTEVLLVEQDAVRYDKGVPYADKLTDAGKTEAVKLEIKSYLRGFVQVVSGLAEGDRVKNQGGSNTGAEGW